MKYYAVINGEEADPSPRELPENWAKMSHRSLMEGFARVEARLCAEEFQEEEYEDFLEEYGSLDILVIDEPMKEIIDILLGTEVASYESSVIDTVALRMAQKRHVNTIAAQSHELQK